MPDAPWEADRDLTQEQVRRAVGEQFPDLAPVHPRLVGAGWDNDVWLVDETWAFKFPRKREAQSWLEREVAMTPVLAEVLPLPVPRFELAGRPGIHFPYRFAGYRFLPGRGADAVRRDRWDEDALARLLGQTLAGLHALPRERLAGVDLPDWRYDAERRRRRVMQRAEAIRAALPADLRDPCAPYLAGALPPPDPDPPRAVVHGDLRPEHVLLDPATGRPTALIDLADVSWSDPAGDFAVLSCWLGRDLFERVVDAYPPGLDAGARERASYFARVYVLTWLDDLARPGAPADASRLLEWVRRAFAT